MSMVFERHAQRFGEPDRVALGALTRRETRQRERENVAARPVFPVHRAGGDDHRVRGVQPAGQPEHHLRVVQRAQPLLQAGDLDVVGLVAVMFQPGRIRRHEREPLDLTAQPDVTRRRVEPEFHPPEGLRGDPMVDGVVVEGAHPQPLRTQQLEVHVGDRGALALGETLRGGQAHAVLPHHRLAVPRQIGGGFALAGRGVDVGGQAPRRRGAGQQRPVFGAPDGDRAAGQVRQHRRARQRRLRARRNRHEHVLADLDVQYEARQVGRGEQQVGAERHLGLTDADGAADAVAGGQLPAFVELPVGRQVGLRHDTEHGAPVDHHGGVVDPVLIAQRRADHQHGHQLGRRDHDVEQRHLDRVEQGVLQQDVLD